MLTEILFGIFLIVSIFVGFYMFALLFVSWYSKKEMFDDKYDYYISLGISEEKAREKAEWHIR